MSLIRQEKYDIIIVGAGLAGLVSAWRCLDVNPDVRILIIESADHIAGDHTWSFNLTDIRPELRGWIEPFIAYQWPNYDVKFPKQQRKLDIPYCTGNSQTLRACVQPYIESKRLQLRVNTQVRSLTDTTVQLEGGESLAGASVLDARGFSPDPAIFLGYQKFVGHVIKSDKPHGLVRPIIMDASVKQLGGYRFMYCLPYSETEVLVEDTYYTDGPELDTQEIDTRIQDYIRNRLGVEGYQIIRRESGILPITLAVDAARNAHNAAKLGIAGGHYHAVTGYSLPCAVRLADELAHKLDAPRRAAKMAHSRHIHSERFFRLLNRMLFRAAPPQQRYKVLGRFYTLPQPLIERFYAGTLTWRDKARILIGKPPVPVSKALYNFSEKAFMKRERAKRKPSR